MCLCTCANQWLHILRNSPSAYRELFVDDVHVESTIHVKMTITGGIRTAEPSIRRSVWSFQLKLSRRVNIMVKSSTSRLLL